jgi:hypothetical protein
MTRRKKKEEEKIVGISVLVDTQSEYYQVRKYTVHPEDPMFESVLSLMEGIHEQQTKLRELDKLKTLAKGLLEDE